MDIPRSNVFYRASRVRESSGRNGDARQQLEQPLGCDVQPCPSRHDPPGQIDLCLHESRPVHVTSHAQEFPHRVPPLHDHCPAHATVQRPLPQKIVPRQLPFPVHSTRHGVRSGQITSSWHDPGPVHAMTQTPLWHVPGQSAPQSGSAASGIPASIGGTAESTGTRASIGGTRASIGGALVSIGGTPVSAAWAPSPMGWTHRPTTPAEAHQPSEPQIWLGAHSEARVQRTTHSPYRGS